MTNEDRKTLVDLSEIVRPFARMADLLKKEEDTRIITDSRADYWLVLRDIRKLVTASARIDAALNAGGEGDGAANEPLTKWLVLFSGGIGPNVWDNELIVEARGVRAALDVAEPQVKAAGGFIDAIEQYGEQTGHAPALATPAKGD